MAAPYHLRPVDSIRSSSSPSPTATAVNNDDRLPSYKPSTVRNSPPSNARARRPLSPSNLRDVDLSVSNDAQQRKYPAPPTGHDLMAMFPAPAPDNFPELRAGPTSGFFSRQERQFFAQAGKEIVRVRVDEIPPGSGGPWPPTASHPASARSASQSPNMSSPMAPTLYPHPSSRPRTGGPTASPLFPLSTNHPHHPHSGPPAGNLHATISLNQSSPDRYPHEKGQFVTEEFDDEAWRQPMPPSERRRAGKHTRRVIVKS